MVIVVLTACSPGRAVEAIMVLADVASVEKPSRIKRTRPQPQRRPISYVVAGRSYRGDLYRPGDHAIAALVLVPGAARAGRNHPRLVAFANSLARARFTVLVPDIENLRALFIDPADARHIADAVQYLSGTTTGTAGRPVGIVAISYAAGPALLAALRPEVRRRVGFVLAIGGYYDIEAVITFFTTGHYRRPGETQWRQREPNAYGKWVFVKSNARRLTDAKDRALLTMMAERKLNDLKADISDLVPLLGAEGRSVHALLANADPGRARALIARLPKAVRSDLRALTLKGRDFSALTAPVILIHGHDDAIIPYSESEALARAIPGGRAELYGVGSLAHVELSFGGVFDILVLWRAVYRLLERRDALAVAPPLSRAAKSGR